MSDAIGRGAAGFAQIQSTDLQTGVYTVTTLAQSFRYTGMVRRSRTCSGSGVLLNDTNNTLGQQTVGLPSGAQSVFAFVSQTTTARHDLDGSEFGSTDTVNKYTDGWGNLNEQTVTASGGGQSFGSKNVSIFYNDGNAWLLGLPSTVQLTKTDAQNNAVTCPPGGRIVVTPIGWKTLGR